MVILALGDAPIRFLRFHGILGVSWGSIGLPKAL